MMLTRPESLLRKSSWLVPLSLIIWGVAFGDFSYGQTKTGRLDTVSDAIRNIDSDEAREWFQAEETLKVAMRESSTRLRATCGLALLYANHAKVDAVHSFVAKLPSLFPAPDSELKMKLTRIQFWDALNRNDQIGSSSGLSNLTRLALEGGETPEAIASASMIGSVVAMLSEPRSDSPIPTDTLQSASRAILECSYPRLGAALSAAMKRASAQAELRTTWLAEHEAMQVEDLRKAAEREELQVEIATKEYRAATSETKKRIEALENEVSTCAQQIQEINFTSLAVSRQWNSCPEIHNPQPPVLANISVPRTKLVQTGMKTVKKERTRTINGKKETETDYEDEPVYKTIIKTPNEIEFERKAIFERMQARYLEAKELRETLLAKKDEMVSQHAKLSKQKDTSTKEIEQLRKARKLAGQELEAAVERAHIATQVAKAASTGNIANAFRPPYFEILDYSAEKKLLLK